MNQGLSRKACERLARVLKASGSTSSEVHKQLQERGLNDAQTTFIVGKTFDLALTSTDDPFPSGNASRVFAKRVKRTLKALFFGATAGAFFLTVFGPAISDGGHSIVVQEVTFFRFIFLWVSAFIALSLTVLFAVWPMLNLGVRSIWIVLLTVFAASSALYVGWPLYENETLIAQLPLFLWRSVSVVVTLIGAVAIYWLVLFRGVVAPAAKHKEGNDVLARGRMHKVSVCSCLVLSVALMGWTLYWIQNRHETFTHLVIDATKPVPQGFLPIHYAASVGNANAVEYLLRRGADPNAVYLEGRWEYKVTTLALALRGGNHEVVRILLDAGAKLEGGELSILASSPARAGKVATAMLLIDHGADVASGDPLRAAVKANDEDLAIFLFEKGAVPRQEFDRSLLGESTSKGHQRLTELLVKSGIVPTGQDFLDAARYCNLDLIELYLRIGGEVDFRGRDSWTALHEVAAYVFRCRKGAELILAAGADVNARTATSAFSPLHIVLDARADLFVLDSELWFVETLVAKGADVKAIAQTQPVPFTPMTSRAAKRYPEVMKILQNAPGKQSSSKSQLSLER